MKKFLFISFFFTIAFILQASKYDYQQQKDSLLQVINTEQGEDTYNAYMHLSLLIFNTESPENVIAFCDQYEAFLKKEIKNSKSKHNKNQKLTGYYGMLMRNKINYLYNLGEMEQAEADARVILNYFSEKKLWTDYYKTYELLLDIVYFAGKSQQAIGEAQSLYKHAKSNHNKSGMAVSTYVLGNIYLERARYAEAEDYLIQCVHFLDNNKDMEYLLVACYERLSDTYLDMEQYDKAMEILQKLENYHNEHTMSRFSFSAKYNLYCNYTKLYIAKGDWNNADTYCSLAENIGISDDSGDFAMSTWMYCRAMILAERKQYKDALNLTEKALQIAYNTYQTEAQMTDGLLELKAKMLKRLGRGNEVFAIYDTILKHTSERANDRFHAQLDELRTQYEVDKHIAEKEHNKSYFLFALAGIAFLVIIVVIIFISRQKMHKKNVALARQILELTKRKGVVCNDPALETDKLFLALENYMQRETPFTEPSFNRETIAYKLNTNEEYLRKTIKKNTNLTISDYILHYRLRFSQDLLLRPTNQYTIEAIAFDSGFGSRSTFYRVFSQKYGLTPSEFRKIAVEKTDE